MRPPLGVSSAGLVSTPGAGPFSHLGICSEHTRTHAHTHIKFSLWSQDDLHLRASVYVQDRKEEKGQAKYSCQRSLSLFIRITTAF